MIVWALAAASALAAAAGVFHASYARLILTPLNESDFPALQWLGVDQRGSQPGPYSASMRARRAMTRR